MPDERVDRAARALGYAGILPQVAAAAWIASGERDAAAIAVTYALLILSFLGGAWWGLAMRDPARQAIWAGVSVLPSLIALALAAVTMMSSGSPWAPVAIGSAIILTLPVDRALTDAGLAPAGWMELRIPLSLALGALTILCGMLTAL